MSNPRLCECGCGEPAPIATRTNTRFGHVKGQPVRFINGHHQRGKRFAKDLTGQRFSRWIVIAQSDRRDRQGRVFWHCRCDCGTEREVAGYVLSSQPGPGRSSSCGCWRREVNAKKAREQLPQVTHGMTYSPEYIAWDNMRARCTRPSFTGWKNYGGRGIRVCTEWLESFEAFYEHIGPKPNPALSLDRINNDGDYEPGNVRWATRSQQRNNMQREEVSA